jgi:hypothetical protein
MENKMKQTIEDTILHGSYKLQTKLLQIDEQEIKGNISKEEKEYLVELARANAQRENEYAKDFNERLEELEKKVKALEDANKVEEPSEGEVVEEYPPFKQPLGGHDSYMKGDKCSENGKKYVSLIDGNNWSPSVYPQGWEEVI